MFPSEPPVKLPTLSTASASSLNLKYVNLSKTIYTGIRAVRRGGGLLVDRVRLSRQSSSLGELRHRLNTSGQHPHESLKRKLHTPYKMAARIPVRQVPAIFARRQPKLFNISKREFSARPQRGSSSQQNPHKGTNPSNSRELAVVLNTRLTPMYSKAYNLPPLPRHRTPPTRSTPPSSSSCTRRTSPSRKRPRSRPLAPRVAS